jgi:hypothetical protein
MKCSICEENLEEQKHPITGDIFWNKGHNAEPINDGRCCDICNDTIVIARRMKIMGMEEDYGQYIKEYIKEYPVDRINGSWKDRKSK